MTFSTFFTPTTFTATVFLLASRVVTATNYYQCIHENPSPVNVISSTAVDKEDLASSFDAFTSLLGGPNNGNDPNTNFAGHRRVNWDADAVPFDMSADFFANVVTRGLVLSATNGGFKVSNPPAKSGIVDDKFDSILDDALSAQFNQFSPSRLFTPFDDNEVIVTFVDPGNANVPADVTGFGAVFVDVDLNYRTKMEYFDEYGCLLAIETVKPEPSGLSFLGVHFGDLPLIRYVKITLGNVSMKRVHEGTIRGHGRDLVVMDDFIYGEPIPIDA